MTQTTVLVTGATGFLGSQAAAALLGDGTTHVVAPVRSHHAPDASALAVAAAVGSDFLPAEWRSRLHQVALPTDADDPGSDDPFRSLDRDVAAYEIDEVVHCAGCLSYTDAELLEAINVGMTIRLVHAAARWGVRRFVYVSTAFAGGFPNGSAEIPERLHDELQSDPTPYTASKRRAEAEIAAAGVPYLILRPSIVIGESTTGRYSGPCYGLYQLWSGLERFLLDDWNEEVHFVAPAHPLPLLHQDAFRAGLVGARAHLPDGSICHLTSQPSPDVAEVAGMFFRDHLRPARAYFHDRITDIDRDGLSRANRMLLRLAAVNLDIAGHRWRFETSSQDRIIAAGTEVPDVTLPSVERCQDEFFNASPRFRRYVDRFRDQFPPVTEIRSQRVGQCANEEPMPIAIYFNPEGMSAAKYDEVMKKLDASGQGTPKGRSHHSTFGPKDRLMVYDVWDSQEDFDAFGQTLMPILAELGVDVGQPDVMPVHNIVQ